nr:MAG TPA: Fis1 N-terminal tetratricopeptide repeat [Microviridae sp.]
MALVRIKDIKQGIEILKEVLKKLDEIYHALTDKEE